MPKICTPLTDTAIRNAKPREKTYTLGDGEGMFRISTGVRLTG